MDAQQRIRLFNPAAEQMFGLRATDAIGQPLARLIPARFRPALDDDLRNLAQSGAPVYPLGTAEEFRARGANDQEFPVDGYLCRTSSGDDHAYTVILRDLTAHQRAQAALRRSEERLRLELDAAFVISFEWDIQRNEVRRYTSITPGLAPTTEQHPSTVEAVREVVHPEDRDLFTANIDAAMEHADGRYRSEFRIVNPDGAIVWLSERGRVERDAQGRPTRLIGLSQDITERKRVEEALRASEERMAGVVEAAMDAIISVDEQQRIRLFNPAAEQVFGLSADDAIDLPLARLIPARSRRLRECHIRSLADQSLAAGRVGTLREMRGVRANGEDFPIEASISQATAAGRRMLTVILRDITERKRAEEALREADRRKDEFLAILAHELRNPLEPIFNAVEILKLQGSSSATAQAARDMIDRQVRQMVRLIDDLTEVSRITRGKLQLHRERVELAAVLEHAPETSCPHLKRAGHALWVSLPPEPIHLDADPARLAQVVTNLLTNACKYTPRGGRIGLSAERDGAEVVVRVTDTGIGILPEHLPSLFEMFSQIDPARAIAQGGLGIGLWLARDLVEMQGGTIEARSDGPGKGSEFIVRLPALDEAATPQPPERQQAPGAETARRVLVVDDNRDIAASLAMLLRLHGHEVETAHDGLAGVEAAERFRPGVVLLDIGMPNLDGYGACLRIREQPWGRHIAIVAL